MFLLPDTSLKLDANPGNEKRNSDENTAYPMATACHFRGRDMRALWWHSGRHRTAMPTLQEALRPLGMKPVLETRAIDPADFKGMPSESNRIWIAGRSIEDWLNASVGKSTCCAACGGADCRTLEIGNETFETIPEQLILKAALLAASQSLSFATGECSDAAPQKQGCCSTVQ